MQRDLDSLMQYEGLNVQLEVKMLNGLTSHIDAFREKNTWESIKYKTL